MNNLLCFNYSMAEKEVIIKKYCESPTDLTLLVIELSIDYCCSNYATVYSILNCLCNHLFHLFVFHK